MMPPARLPLILLALLSALPAAAQYRTKFPLKPAALTDTLGVNIHFTDPKPGEMKLLAAAGFRWIRMDLGWAGIERERGKYDFSAYDRLMDSLKANGGIRPIFILDYGNDLYEKGSPRTPEARAAFARFAAATVTHFKNRGVLWEMWNEPNIGFWKPTPNVDEYIALALETGKAIRQAAPDEYYIGAGVSGMDFHFLERCFQSGLLEFWDAVSFHPYRNTAPETAAADFQRVRELLARYSPKGKTTPILSSEWGYSELYPTLNLEKQSKYIVREFLSNAVNGLPVSIWYDWRDDGIDPKEPEHHFGTVFNDFKPKPTYKALQTLTETLRGFHYNKRLALDSPDDYCLLFDDGKGAARLAVWTTNPKPHEATLPADGGNFTVTGYTGERSEITAKKDGLRVTLTDAPQYLVPQGEAKPCYLNAIRWGSLPPYLLVDNSTDASLQLFALLGGTWSEKDYPATARVIARLAEASPFPAQTCEISMPPYDKRDEFPYFDIPIKINRRDSRPANLRVTLAMKGISANFAQETLLAARRPLSMTLLPALGNAITVELSDPFGDPVTGYIELTHARDGFDSSPDMVVTSYGRIVAEGKTQGQVRINLPNGSSGPYTASARLVESSAGAGRSIGAQSILRAPKTRFTPLTPFASPSNFKLEADGDPKVDSTVSLGIGNAAEKLDGQTVPSAKISYSFDAGWKFLRLAARGAMAAAWPGKPTQLGMWVYGDGSGDILRTRFADATGQTFQTGAEPSERLDWRGWRFVKFPLNGVNAGHWGGANDGVIHYPIHSDTLLLIDSPNQLKHSGVVSITGATLLEEKN